jgi:hypothetical protein
VKPSLHQTDDEIEGHEISSNLHAPLAGTATISSASTRALEEPRRACLLWRLYPFAAFAR